VELESASGSEESAENRYLSTIEQVPDDETDDETDPEEEDDPEDSSNDDFEKEIEDEFAQNVLEEEGTTVEDVDEGVEDNIQEKVEPEPAEEDDDEDDGDEEEEDDEDQDGDDDFMDTDTEAEVETEKEEPDASDSRTATELEIFLEEIPELAGNLVEVLSALSPCSKFLKGIFIVLLFRVCSEVCRKDLISAKHSQTSRKLLKIASTPPER